MSDIDERNEIAVQAFKVIYYEAVCPDCNEMHELDNDPNGAYIECSCGCNFYTEYK